MADTCAKPINGADLEQLFDDFSRYDEVFLAVSGGVDSCALMHLAVQWRARTKWPGTLRVLTVDHGLRPAAAGEARRVVEQATRLGVPAVVLKWGGPKPCSGVQEAARAARYQLMLDHIRSVSKDPAQALLVTAHHREDLAETLLMRLARGAGVDGLAAIQTLSFRDGIAVGRPLLDVPKARLRATVDAAGDSWIEDPSNADMNFERVRLRSLGQVRSQLGLDDDKLALTARRMFRARDALERMTDEWLAAHLAEPLLARCGVFVWPWQTAEVPNEIAVRALMRLLPALGGVAGPLRLLRAERLWDDMQEADFTGATLGNCVISRDGTGRMYLYREPRRGTLPRVALEDGRPLIWDNRFEIQALHASPSRLQVRPLARSDLEMIDLPTQLPGGTGPVDALLATPVIAAGTEILAIPALNMHDVASQSQTETRISCRFLVERIAGGASGQVAGSDCDSG